jgi:hypothetical protein
MLHALTERANPNASHEDHNPLRNADALDPKVRDYVGICHRYLGQILYKGSLVITVI